jgi:hypothetical protein
MFTIVQKPVVSGFSPLPWFSSPQPVYRHGCMESRQTVDEALCEDSTLKGKWRPLIHQSAEVLAERRIAHSQLTKFFELYDKLTSGGE